MNQTSKKRKTLIIVGIVITFCVVVGLVAYALATSSTKSESASTTKPSAPWPRTATKNEINQNLSDLKASLKQAQTDSESAKSALNDSNKQIKVGN